MLLNDIAQHLVVPNYRNEILALQAAILHHPWRSWGRYQCTFVIACKDIRIEWALFWGKKPHN